MKKILLALLSALLLVGCSPPPTTTTTTTTTTAPPTTTTEATTTAKRETDNIDLFLSYIEKYADEVEFKPDPETKGGYYATNKEDTYYFTIDTDADRNVSSIFLMTDPVTSFNLSKPATEPQVGIYRDAVAVAIRFFARNDDRANIEELYSKTADILVNDNPETLYESKYYIVKQLPHEEYWVLEFTPKEYRTFKTE